MGALTLVLTLSGGALDEGLSLLETRLKGMSAPLEEFGRMMLRSVELNFVMQGRPEGWAPLSESTVRRKGSSRILVDTGRLRSSIGYTAGDDSLTVNSDTPYAAIQQQGGHAGRDGMAVIPSRPFLVFQDEDIRGLCELITAHLCNSL